MIYTRTIRTLVGPVTLTIGEITGGYYFDYSMQPSTPGSDMLIRRQYVIGDFLARADDPVGVIQHIEETALADLGRKLTREIQ